MDNNITSTLILEKLVFDNFSFKRLGFKNNNPLNLKFKIEISEKNNDELYRVTIVLDGKKDGEYEVNISLSGFFTFSNDSQNKKEIKDIIISQNTVAIMMPYIRSQLSLITAQPEVNTVILPPLNIANIMNEQNE